MKPHKFIKSRYGSKTINPELYGAVRLNLSIGPGYVYAPYVPVEMEPIKVYTWEEMEERKAKKVKKEKIKKFYDEHF